MNDKLSNEKIIRITVFFCDIVGTIDGCINDSLLIYYVNYLE